jgi:D-glycero-D-manno-heptose 1,7-bisphosphate phosphatase
MISTLPVVSAPETPMSGMHWRIAAAAVEPRPGLILDRDGVLVDFVDYLHRPHETRLAEGVADLVLRMRTAGAAVGVVTNQAGIARSLYDWSDYFAVEEEIDRQLATGGAALDAVVACPYHPDFTAGWSEQHSYWRKPGPGMINFLLSRLNIERERCWLIGDHITDIRAAGAAGLPGAMLVKKGWGATYEREALSLANNSFEVVVIEAVSAAGSILTERMGLE